MAQIIRKVMGGGFSSCTNFFSLTSPLKEYFFRMQDLVSGLLTVHEFFSLNFPLHGFVLYFAPHPDKFSNGLSLIQFLCPRTAVDSFLYSIFVSIS